MVEQNIYITTDIVVEREGKILLIRRKANPFKGQWALPGGFVENKERVKTAALRELQEETGIEADESQLRFIGYFDSPERDPRGRTISFAFSTELKGDVKTEAGDDAEEARWFDTHKLPELAFDHTDIISKWRTSTE